MNSLHSVVVLLCVQDEINCMVDYLPFYASAAKRAKALCSRVVRPSGCPAVRPIFILRRQFWLLRQHGPTDLIHNLFKRSTHLAKVFYQRSRLTKMFC